MRKREIIRAKIRGSSSSNRSAKFGLGQGASQPALVQQISHQSLSSVHQFVSGGFFCKRLPAAATSAAPLTALPLDRVALGWHK